MINRSVKAAFFLSCCVLFAAMNGCVTKTGDFFKPEEMEPYSHDERFLVGVLQLYNNSGESGISQSGEAFSSLMIGSLQEYGRYRLVENDRIQALLDAQSFQMTGLVDSDTVQEVGKLLGVEALCISTLDRCDYSVKRTSALIAWIDTQEVEIAVNTRIVAVSTGEVLATAQTAVTRGRKLWVAFGFMKIGGLVEKELLYNEAVDIAVKKLALQLSERAPGK